MLQPLAQRPAIVLETRQPVATAPDEFAWKTAQLPGQSAGRSLQETAEPRVQLPGAPARLQSHHLPHACVSTRSWFSNFCFRPTSISLERREWWSWHYSGNHDTTNNLGHLTLDVGLIINLFATCPLQMSLLQYFSDTNQKAWAGDIYPLTLYYDDCSNGSLLACQFWGASALI
jgi:hypothetical protein